MKEAWALGEECISQCLTLFLYFHVSGRNFSLYAHTYDVFFALHIHHWITALTPMEHHLDRIFLCLRRICCAWVLHTLFKWQH